jgi:hypothetical protein
MRYARIQLTIKLLSSDYETTMRSHGMANPIDATEETQRMRPCTSSRLAHWSRSFARCAWLIACGGDARPSPTQAPPAPAALHEPAVVDRDPNAAREGAPSPAPTAPAQPAASAPAAPLAPPQPAGPPRASTAVPAARNTPTAELAADSPCAALCTHSIELGCKAAADCESLCKQSLAGEMCAAQQRAVTTCMLAQPTTRWECSEVGVAALKDGACEPEQESFVKCVTSASDG